MNRIIITLLLTLPIVVSSLYAGEAPENKAGLDLSPYKLDLVYETDFENPDQIRIVHERKDLFKNGDRQPLPDDADWVYEGRDKAWIDNGKLWMGGDDSQITENTKIADAPIGMTLAQDHSVIWNTRAFPESFLLEFQFTDETHKAGLNIVFFAARPRDKYDATSIFDPALPLRNGNFKNYINGAINNYHISYRATTGSPKPRGFSNMRKNHGFHKVTNGKDFISQTEDLGPHTVRLLKVGNHVVLAENGKVALEWTDDGEKYGPVLGDGYIGLRQMRHTAVCSYDYFKVWRVSTK